MSRYTLMDYFSIYVEEWDSLLEEFLRHLAMTSFSVVPVSYTHLTLPTILLV